MENEFWNIAPKITAALERVRNEEARHQNAMFEHMKLERTDPDKAAALSLQMCLALGEDWAEKEVALVDALHDQGMKLQAQAQALYVEACERDPDKLLRDAAACLASASKEDFEATRRGDPALFGGVVFRETQIAPEAAISPLAAADALLSPQREAARELDRKHGGSRLRALHDLEADKIEALGYPRPGKFERRAAFSTPGDKALEKANSRDRAGRRNNWPLGLNGEIFSIIPEKPFPAFKVEKNGRSREVSLAQIPPNIRGFFLDPTRYKGRLKFTQLPMNADKLWRLTREKLAEENNLDALLKFTLEEFVNVCGLAGKDREAQLAAANEAAASLSCFRLVLEGWAYLGFVDLCGFDSKTETFAIHLHAGFLQLTLAARPLLLFQSRALLALQECDRPAYFMGREMETHASIDKNRLNGTADRLSVGKLLDTSGLPRLRELKTEARKWKERIKGRFEAELDKLRDMRKYPDRHPFLYNWEYLAPGGRPISPEEVEKLDYELWRKLLVRFEFFEPLPEREAARIERKREKLAAANAKREEARAVSSALPDGWASFDFQRVASGLSRRKRVPKSAPVLEVEATSTATAEKPKPTSRPSTDPQTRIAQLEARLAAETDPETRKAIEATIENYRKRL